MMISRKRFQNDRRGFTLIELLVVVAIIALLISILLPSLDRARRQSRQLVCATNLKSQNSACIMYAADNQDYVVSGMVGIGLLPERGYPFHPGWNSYATSQLPYLGWTGNKNIKIKRNVIVDIPADPMNLWKGQAGFNDSTFLEDEVWRARAHVLARMEQFQCPDYPDFETTQGMHWDPEIEPVSPSAMPLDYVSNASPIPYTANNQAYDTGHMEFGFFVPPEPVDINLTRYEDVRRIENFQVGLSPADYIWATEGHTQLDTRGPGEAMVFHHFFAGAHLPFSAEPRIAVDSRHPGGINAMFFDGHVETLELHEIDPASDASDFDNYTDRLSKITYVPEYLRP